jgi:hypothetical protein
MQISLLVLRVACCLRLLIIRQHNRARHRVKYLRSLHPNIGQVMCAVVTLVAQYWASNYVFDLFMQCGKQAVTSLRFQVLKAFQRFVLPPSLGRFIAFMMEAVLTSETSTSSYIPGRAVSQAFSCRLFTLEARLCA